MTKFKLSLKLVIMHCDATVWIWVSWECRVGARVIKWVGEGVRASSHSAEEREWPVVVRPLLLSKKRPHYKAHESLGERNKHMVMGPNGTWNQDSLWSQGPAAIIWIGQSSNLWKQTLVVSCNISDSHSDNYEEQCLLRTPYWHVTQHLSRQSLRDNGL